MTENIYFAVCERCLVKCVRKFKDYGYTLGRMSWCECPICGNCDAQLSNEECSLSEDELEGNLLFFNSIKDGLSKDG